ncbi:hypothetical protein [Streptomyces altiplanensis]
MFTTKNRRITDLEQRVARLVEERDDARTAAAVHLVASVRTAGRNTHLDDRLDLCRNSLAVTTLSHTRTLRRLRRAVRACARYRHELAAQARRIRSLEGQLDDLLGLNNPTILDGAHWQDRRTDKPRGVKP